MPVGLRLGPVRATALLLLLGAVLGTWCAPSAQAQQTRPDSTQADTARADTARTDTARADSLLQRRRAGAAQRDTTQRDTVDAPTSDGGAAGGTADEPDEAVQFSARDSLVIDLGGEEQGDVGTLYGEAKVEQQDATLTAYEVQFLFDRSTLRATGPPEGVRVDTMGLPRFQRGEGEAFTGRELSFNLQTRRGRIVAARTRAPERNAFVGGENVRVEEDSTLFIRNGSYTTCNCPRDQTPSYSLRSGKMKVQGDWVYTGPIQLFIYNIPTPLVLPFAFLPSVAGRHGGIIPPSYGRDDRLGLYLRDFGYYWPISDYMDLQLTGSLWSRGSWAVSPTFRYKRRYHYDGDLRVDYQRNTAGDVVDANYLDRTNAQIQWTHRQQFIPSGAPNSASLNANVNLASETYRKVVSDDFNDNVTQRTSSSVNFRKKWNDGNQNLRANLTQQQNLTTGRASLTLPDLGFSQSNVQPFKRERRGPGEEERWYEKITTSYDGNLSNTFTFDPLPDSTLARRGAADVAWYDALLSQSDYRRATGDESQRFDFGVEHQIPVKATFRIPRYQLNITPRFDYEERWLPNTKRRVLRTVPGEVDTSGAYVTNPQVETVTREEAGFFAAREFDLSVGANTTFYGLFPLRLGALQGLRHEVQPSLTFTYEPDYTTDLFGRTRTYTNEEGERVRYDITDGRVLGRQRGRRSVSLSLRNEFETKEVRIDSTGTEQEEVLRLMTLSASSSYNFKADSLRLSDVRVRADFPVLDNKFNIDASTTLAFSPYVYSAEGRQLNRLVLNETGVFPARLTDFDLSISTELQGGGAETRRNDPFRQRGDLDPTTGGGAQVSDAAPQNVPGRPSLRQGVGQYANFEIPWSLGLRFSYGFSNRETFDQSDFLLNADFDFNLTPRWKVSGNTGYDFDRGELTSTRLNITRNFECWQMAFTWTPFGRYQSYSFNLYVKTGVLRDLLNLRIPREGGFGDRLRGVASQVTQAGQ